MAMQIHCLAAIENALDFEPICLVCSHPNVANLNNKKLCNSFQVLQSVSYFDLEPVFLVEDEKREMAVVGFEPGTSDSTGEIVRRVCGSIPATAKHFFIDFFQGFDLI